MVVQVVGRTDLLDPPVVDHDDLVGDLEGLLLVVGHEHGGDVHLVVQATEPVAQLLADLGIECTEGFVQQQHVGLDRERSGQGHALPLPAGELRRQSIGELVEVHQLEQLHDARADLCLGDLANLEPERHVAVDAQVLERCVVLEHEADVPLLGTQPRRVGAVDLDDAGVRLLQTGDDAQQRGLAAAGRPEQRREVAAVDVDRDVAESDEVAEVLVDVANADAHG